MHSSTRPGRRGPPAKAAAGGDGPVDRRGVRAVDIVALLVCAGGVILALQGTRELYVASTWSYTVGGDATGARLSGGSPYTRIPPPIVVDLDNDGVAEVLVATAEPSLLVLAGGETADLPHGADGAGGGSSSSGNAQGRGARPGDDRRLIARTSLLASVEVSVGRQPVAMGTGFITPFDENAAEPRKRVVVVLTDGWVALCFNHKLELLWEVEVNAFVDSFVPGASLAANDLYFREAVVSVLPVGVDPSRGDKGVVLVGGSVQRRAASRNTVSVHPDEEHEMDVAESEALAEENEALLRHFSVYALNAQDGATRWRHEGSEFPDVVTGDHRALPQVCVCVCVCVCLWVCTCGCARVGRGLCADLPACQNEYKLGKPSAERRARAKEGCRQHRVGMVGAMPHAWAQREDTKVTVSHFERRKPSRPGDGATVRVCACMG